MRIAEPGADPRVSGYQRAPWRRVDVRFPSKSTRCPVSNKVRKLELRTAPARLDTPTDLSREAVREISAALNGLLADTFALYLKTRNFHWHVSGPHFRDYHLLLDEQAEQLENSIDILAERVRKVGGTTIRSIGHIAKLQRVEDNDADYVPALDMLSELMSDNKAQIRHMREAHKLTDEHEDVATASLLEVFIDEAEKRCWFLFEASRDAERTGH
jgi:starvation-inducible DNA-binding protein